jgi:dipeptidase
MRKYISIIGLSCLCFFNNNHVNACTNLLITKGASTDGSTIITYAADSHNLYGELYYKAAKTYPQKSTMIVYEWDTGKELGVIRQATQTYSVVGNMNEHQLAIGETTYGGREELVDSTAKLDYGSLIYITLQRAKTARAAIDTIAYLMNENGYYSSGESFSISDPNEVWIMEIIGKGSPQLIKDKKGKIIQKKYNKGAVWVARRVPEGYISGHANQARIKQFPLNDPENCKYAKDVISFAKEKGWFIGEDKDFSFSDTYAPLTFESLRFCEARVYSMFNRAAPSLKLSIDYVKGVDGAEPLPLWIKPDKKLSVQDAMALMRDHYEGTELDMTQDVGAGPYKCPYRWRPLTWKVDSVAYFNERAVSTQQTGFSFVSQSRAWLPNAIGGILWFGLDDSYSTVYIPMYCSMTNIPMQFAEKNGNLFEYSETSAFWAFNYVSNFAYSRYSDMIVDIQKVQTELETKFAQLQPAVEKAALELYNSGNVALTSQYLNEYSVQQSEITFNKWKELGHNLLVKYMDGNVKDQNKKVLHPAYPQYFYKAIVNETGEKLKVKKIKGEK